MPTSNVRVQSNSEMRSRSSGKRSKSKFKSTSRVSDLDTGRSTTNTSKSVSKNGKERRSKSKFVVRDSKGKKVAVQKTRNGKITRTRVKPTFGRDVPLPKSKF